MASQSTDIIRTAPRPACYRCDVQGLPLYQELEDRLHGAPGKWDLKRCPNHECGMVWLDPMPVEEDIAKAYQNYYTHQDTERRTAKLILRLYYEGRAGYLAHKFGYYSQGLALWNAVSSPSWFKGPH